MSVDKDCEIIRPLLSVYVDEEAEPSEVARVEAHIAACAQCASELAFLRLSQTVLSEPADVPPPTALRARIAAATYARPTLRQRALAWLQPAPARLALGTAAAAGIVAAFLALRPPVVPPATGRTASSTDRKPAATSARPAPSTTQATRSGGEKSVTAVAPKPLGRKPAVMAPNRPDHRPKIATETGQDTPLKSPRMGKKAPVAAPISLTNRARVAEGRQRVSTALPVKPVEVGTPAVSPEPKPVEKPVPVPPREREEVVAPPITPERVAVSTPEPAREEASRFLRLRLPSLGRTALGAQEVALVKASRPSRSYEVSSELGQGPGAKANFVSSPGGL